MSVSLLEVIDNSLGVLALLVGILFIRHRNDDESQGFRWLGAGFLLFFMNHSVTGAIAAAFPRTLGWNLFALVTASVTLACLFIGLRAHSAPRALATTASTTPTSSAMQLLGVTALVMLTLVFVRGGRAGYTPLLHAVPAAVAGYGAVLQARLFRAEPFMGHELTAASLASHPVAWSLLALTGISGTMMQQILSIPFVLAGVATFSASRLRIQAQMRKSRLDRSTGFLTPEGFAEVAEHRLTSSLGDGTWCIASVRLEEWERSFRALQPGNQQLALTTLAQRMADPVGRERHIARTGSADFLLLLRDARLAEDTDGPDDLQELLHRLSPPIITGQYALQTKPRVGYARFPNDGADLATLRSAAELARSVAGDLDARRPARYQPHMRELAEERLRIGRQIMLGLSSEAFDLHYQPIVPSAPGPITSAEALLRWHSPSRGLVPAAEFVASAEAAGLMTQLTTFVMERVRRDVTVFRRQIHPDFRVSINIPLSVLTEVASGIAPADALFSERESPSTAIDLELTESASMGFDPAIRSLLEGYRRRGMRIALDDFGMGFSSCGQLDQLPIDALKVDGAFLTDIDRSPRRQGVLRAILALGRELQIQVVIEGVETRVQQEVVSALGATHLQGFLTGPPVPARTLIARLSRTA